MRKNSGSTVVLQVDNYEPVEYHFDIKASADAQFNNIQYMYIGKNESMTDGFVGCVSRVQFDDIYPLKLMFQQNPPPNVKSLGSELFATFCYFACSINFRNKMFFFSLLFLGFSSTN